MIRVFAVYAMFGVSSSRALPAGIKHVAHRVSVVGDKRGEISGGMRSLDHLCVCQRVSLACCSDKVSVFAVS